MSEIRYTGTVDVEDRTQPPKLTEKQFAEKVLELLRLVDGLQTANYTCACRRLLRVGITAELKALLPDVKREALERAGTDPEQYNPETGRFGLLEVD